MDHDTWLLEGSEPAPWDEDNAPHGLCPDCETPMEFDTAEGEFCAICEPRCSLECSPIRASFRITDGVVTEIAL